MACTAIRVERYRSDTCVSDMFTQKNHFSIVCYPIVVLSVVTASGAYGAVQLIVGETRPFWRELQQALSNWEAGNLSNFPRQVRVSECAARRVAESSSARRR